MLEKKAKVIKEKNLRSFIVRDEQGKEYVRNRQHLLKIDNDLDYDDIDKLSTPQ